MNKKREQINGLVLAGGFSQRMKQDKAMLCYYDKPQYEHIYDLLQLFCNQAYISSKLDKSYPLPCVFDADEYIHIGPIAGLLSAFDLTDSAWLVVAIDYPLFLKEEIDKLVEERDKNYLATVYCHAETDFFEPFLGIYEPQFAAILHNEIKIGNYSLQQILRKNNVKKVFPSQDIAITSVDTIEDFNKIYHAIHRN